LRAQLRAANARADAEAANAAAAREREEAAREREEAAHKAAFLRYMSSMANASAATSTSASLELRAGVPSPVVSPLDTVLFDVPVVDDERTATCWLRFRQAVLRTLPGLTPETSLSALQARRESLLVTPLLAAALGELESADTRLWREQSCEESLAPVEPDFVWTCARDALPSVLGTLFSLEVKRWGREGGRNRHSVRQAGGYARRVLHRMYRELLDRGAEQAELAALSVLCAGSTGDSITFLRTFSGAPASGSYRAAQPCVSICTESLPLLAGLEAGGLPLTPPAGFVALLRVLSAPAACTARALAAPLDALVLSEPLVLADGTRLEGSLALSERLGRGGCADAYALAHPRLAGCVLKLPRCASETVSAQLASEERALRRLQAARCPNLPTLLGVARRAVDAPLSARRQPWRALILAPLGRRADSCVVGGAAERAAAADAVMAGLLAALRVVHACGLVHCDVRPYNVVVLDTPAGGTRSVLLDFGLACAIGEDAAGRGVPAFAALSTGGELAASRALDLAAAAYTWAALACGSPAGAPPWRHEDERAEWFEDAAAEKGGLWAALQGRLVALEAAAGDVDDSFYVWPWT